ncbi:tetratricopeptide repeat-containing sensor histidine kinase [Foetidibacter luteolus]|uniref:tetratricopeptide repeat-containing sensor histidine kinase n=1 Tax=Foetidibacter luteolus TaxID=2608880 RepID=UPI00129B5D30|nr:ATP-binding protein [Foetidibacter luteolus]
MKFINKSNCVLYLAFVAYYSLAVTSCTTTADKMVKHYSEAHFAFADSLSAKDSLEKSLSYIDSIYQQFPYVSVADKYRYFHFKSELYGSKYRPGKKFIEAYGDSMVLLIVKNKLEKQMWRELAKAYNYQSVQYLNTGLFELGHKYAALSRIVSLQNGDSCTAGEYASAIALIYYRQSNYAAAADLFKESAITAMKNCDRDRHQFYSVQGALSNAALSYIKLGSIDSALKYYSLAENYILNNRQLYSSEPKFPEIALSVVYGNMGHAFQKIKDYRQAKIHYYKSITINNRIGYDNKGANSGKIYMARLCLEQGDADSCLLLLNEIGQQIADDDEDIKLLWLKLKWEYAEKYKPVAAFDNLRAYSRFRDSLLEKSKGSGGFNPQTAFDKIAAEFEIEILKKDSQIRLIYLIGSLTIGGLLGTLFFSVFKNLKRSKKMIVRMEALNTELSKREKELVIAMDELEERKRQKYEEDLFLQELNLRAENKDSMVAQRRKISEDMHDDLSNSLAALKYYIDDIKSSLEEPVTKEVLENVGAEISVIHENARRYTHNLNLSTNELQYNLIDFLFEISEKFAKKTSLTIAVAIDKEKIHNLLSSVQHEQLYHIMKEGISNVIKHAKATRIDVAIEFDGQCCYFSITDNGKGFKKEGFVPGLGLKSMDTRIKKINGKLSIEQGAAGTYLSGSFPIFY